MGERSGWHAGKTRVLLGILATVYALALSTRKGKRWAQQQTWATVVAGTGLTLGAIALDDRKLAERTFWYFVVSGLPLVVRSLVLQVQDRAEAEASIFDGNAA